MGPELWSMLGRIARGVFRIITASFMTVIVAAAAYWLWTTIQDRRLEAIVSKTRDWGDQPLPLPAPATATLKTRCGESRLYYLLTIRPKTGDELSLPKEKTPSKATGRAFEDMISRRIEEFRIHLYDRDGFLMVKETLAPDRLTTILGDNRETAGFEINATTACDKEAYSRVAKWSIGWSERK